MSNVTSRKGITPKEAAHKTMDEVGGALIAIALVLIGVFLPTAFITGLQGSFFKQFAITIAASTAISLMVSLTLSPAMAALLLKPHATGHEKRNPLVTILGAPLRWFFAGFNHLFDTMSHGYAWLTRNLIVRVGLVLLVVYGALIGVAAADGDAYRSHSPARPCLFHHRLPAASWLDAKAHR